MSRAIVLLHGFLGCGEDWQATREALGGAGEVHTPDLPGHGRASAPVPPDFAGAVAALAARVEAAGGGQPCDLVGYSMGGRLALALAVERPALLRRLCVIGASPGLEDEEERARRRALDERRARALETEPFEEWLRAWYEQPLFAGLRAAPGFPALLARRRRARPADLAKALRVLSPGRQPPLRQRLATCSVPALLLAGARDPVYVESNRALADANLWFGARTVPEAGHAPHLEQPDEFHRILRDWLGRP